MAEAISFAQDSQGFVVAIEVVEIECSYLTSSGARVIEQVQDGVVAEALGFFQVNGPEDLQDFLRVQKADQLLLCTFLGDVHDSFGTFSVLRVDKADHFSERFYGGKSLVSGLDSIYALRFEMIEESQDEITREVIYLKGFDLDTMVLGGKGQKEGEAIPVGCGGFFTAALYAGQVLIKKLPDAG